MAIKNKDGSTFRLSRPNPIMKDQNFWNDGFVLHNFGSQEEILHNFDTQDELIPKPEPESKKPKKKYQPIEEITPQEINVPIKESSVSPEHKVRKRKANNIVLLHCMPATTIDSHDPLYNENRTTTTYNEQFTFEAIITSSSDLAFQIWTTKELDKNSIIYQPSNRRWWKVESTVNRKDGFIIDCTPSSIQPSFKLP